MPSILIKIEPDVDWYVMWSTVVDNWVAAGSRAEIEDEYSDELDMVKPERFDRADQYGTSDMSIRNHKWGDDEFLVTNVEGRDCETGFFTIDRQFVRNWIESNNHALLTPVPPEDET